MGDFALWQNMKLGNRQAFKEIYDGQAATLIAYGRRFTSDNDLVHDCLHDLFVYIWSNRQNLAETDSIGRYLAVALRRRIIQAVKSRKMEGALDEEATQDQIAFAADDVLIRSEEKDALSQRLKVAFKDLSARQQEVLYLRFFKGMGYEDIAQVMEIEYQSVRNLMYSGLKALRKSGKFLILLIILSLA